MSYERRKPRLLVTGDRVLSAINALILILLGIGVPVFLFGRASNDIPLSTVAAYMIFIGIVVLVTRIVYWLAEGIVKQGMETMAKQRPGVLQLLFS